VSTPVFHRRRAARLAVLLDETARGRRHHRRAEVDGELGDLVRLAGRVGQVEAAPDPDPEFRDSLRTLLMAKIERDGIGVTATQRSEEAATRAALAGKTQVVRSVPAGGGRARAAVLTGFTAGALALSGVSAASTDALPGDALYQVKRSTERAQLAMAGSDVSRGQLQLEFASARLGEATRMHQGIGQLLEDMDAATTEGMFLVGSAAVQRRDQAALDQVISFVDRQRDRLTALAGRVPGDAAALQHSALVLGEVEERARDLQQSLQRGCEMVGHDDYGPKPC
jgi:hypothetical protein